MAYFITTAAGRVIDVEAVTPGAQYPVLHIHTTALTGAQAYAVFSDPAETREITEEKDVLQPVTNADGTQAPEIVHRTRVFRDFTQLHSVGPSPFYKGALLIWLNKPAEEEE